MVVAHVEASGSAPNPPSVRRNRRKQSKKPARTADSSAQDVDDEMNDVGPSTFKPPVSSGPQTNDNDDDLMIDAEPASLPLQSSAPAFPPASANAGRTTLKSETRRIPMPPHRMTPLKKDWLSIFGPLTEILGLQVRMNVQRKSVELRVCFGVLSSASVLTYTRDFQTSKATTDIGALQKGADFVKAFALGFDINVRFL